MKLRKILFNLGRMLLVGAVLLLIPIIVSVIYHDGTVIAFLISAAADAAVGGLFVLLFGKNVKSLTGREGMAVAALSWIVLSVFGALPSVISGAVPSFTDAFFDTVSGFTTTGATVLTSMEALPKSILFWRSLTHWVGGLGILALAIAILPNKSSRSGEGSSSDVFAIRAEAPGPTFGKLTTKLKFSTQILYLIYLGLTVLEIVLLLCGGMPVFDSIANSFATMGSGGFAVTDAGIAGYGSAYIEWVIAVFMIFAGLNFNFVYFLVVRKFARAFKMEDVRWYLGIIVTAAALITANIYSLYNNFGDAVRASFFQVATIISTTGFSTADFSSWPGFSQTLLVLLMFIGGCVGSTGGGLKVSRVIVFFKTAIKEVRYHINPKEIRSIKFEGQPLDHSVVTGISSYLVVFSLLFVASTLIVAIDGHDFSTTFTAVAACINNIGPGLSKVGPTSNFSCMSTLSKYVLSLDMLLGRLELFPLLVLCSPNAWKK